ncbi:MAG TPA: class I SAM-dependent methyltransferase [archaeon]|nr:class I SAM-dependent methyltransferase [archaeon]
MQKFPFTDVFNKKDLSEDMAAVTLEYERKMLREMPKNTQSNYFELSLFSLPVSRAIVHGVFDEFADDRTEIAEFGSGIYGRLYNLYARRKHRRKWQQFDINPDFVEENKKFTHRYFLRWPKVRVGDIYDMPLADESVDVIVGLSSWDSVFFFDLALKEVSRCLKPNGLFMHFQDMLPAEFPIRAAECRKREAKNLPAEFSCTYVIGNDYPQPWLVAPRRFLVGLESTDDGDKMLTSSRYLTQHLARTAERYGFGILKNETVERTVEQSRRALYHPFTWLTLRDLENNNLYVTSPDAANDASYDRSVPKGKVRVVSSMDVLVAQKH